MTEALLHFIWKEGLYALRPSRLYTLCGQPVSVHSPGQANMHAGPDFLDARIDIGGTLWAGSVELHLRASDWSRHGHADDRAYGNVVLHVVYEADAATNAPNCPVLCLKEHVDPALLQKYSKLLRAHGALPCASMLGPWSGPLLDDWAADLLVMRWRDKWKEWGAIWEGHGRDWNELLYWKLAANFGFHVNRDAFLALARSLPWRVLWRHRGSLFQTEALLFGQAGWLGETGPTGDGYRDRLAREYSFLSQKYGLEAIGAHRWRFLRLRPNNFPTIRVAQFAALVHFMGDQVYALCMERRTEHLRPLRLLRASAYWDGHYRFGVPAPKAGRKYLGGEAIRSILVNTIAPVRFYMDERSGLGQGASAIALLAAMPAENNHMLRQWARTGPQAVSALGSQARMQLMEAYCRPKKCLSCRIGQRLLLRLSPIEGDVLPDVGVQAEEDGAGQGGAL